MKYLLTVLFGGFMVMQQPTWNQQPAPIIPHQPMTMENMPRPKSHLDKFNESMNGMIQNSGTWADNMEEIRRARGQSK